MWFKKKSVLQAEGNYNTEKSADGTSDLRTTYKKYENRNSSIYTSGLPSTTDAGKYFYLPASGLYNSGQLYSVGFSGQWWSSSAHPQDSYGRAYDMSFNNGLVIVDTPNRFNGFRAEVFQ